MWVKVKTRMACSLPVTLMMSFVFVSYESMEKRESFGCTSLHLVLCYLVLILEHKNAQRK